MCDVEFKEIIRYYAQWQNWYSSYLQLRFNESLHKINFSSLEPRLIIIYDLMRESDKRVLDLFTKNDRNLKENKSVRSE